MRWLVLLLLGGCVLDGYWLTLERTMNAGNVRAHGVDSDDAGGLWLVFRGATSDYYERADVRVVHVDAEGTTLAEFRYTDEYSMVTGLAFTGDAVWINYSHNRVRKLDPATGAEIGSFATPPSIVDLDARDDVLLLSSQFNTVIGIDQARGGELWRANIDAFGDGGTQRGIAADGDHTWVLSQDSKRVHLVDDSGDELGSASIPGYDLTTRLDHEDQLAWDGDELILLHDNVLTWFRVYP